MKKIILNYITGEESEKFAEWSIGKNYRNILQNEWPKYWKHQEKLKIDGNGYLYDDLPKMIELWKSSIRDEV